MSIQGMRAFSATNCVRPPLSMMSARADIMLSGGRSQFVALKARMPWMDINQERHHAFAGYEGMVTMIAEIDKALFNPVWAQVRTPAPWESHDALLALEA